MEGLIIREATAADIDRVADLHVLSRSTTYAALLPAGATDSLTTTTSRSAWRHRLPRLEQYTLRVASNHPQQILGFGLASVTSARGTSIHALHVHPDSQGYGIGGALLDTLGAVAHGWGRHRWRLTVLAANGRARAFYENRGWLPAGMGAPHRIGDHLARTVDYERHCPCEETG